MILTRAEVVEPAVRWLDITSAAARLGMTPEAVRRRIYRTRAWRQGIEWAMIEGRVRVDVEAVGRLWDETARAQQRIEASGPLATTASRSTDSSMASGGRAPFPSAPPRLV